MNLNISDHIYNFFSLYTGKTDKRRTVPGLADLKFLRLKKERSILSVPFGGGMSAAIGFHS